MTDPKDCPHNNVDLSWSHGECPRCIDCGMVGEFAPFPDIVWGNDPLTMAAELMVSSEEEAADHMISYLALAKWSGFSVYDERLKELTKN